MRNRQLIELLIFPKYFLSLAIPYKGKYLVRIRVFQKKLLNDKITHAYPKMGEFEEEKSLKQYQKGRIAIGKDDVFYETETFFLYYSNQKVNLNTYCMFRLQYDEIREFKTFLEFELVRKSDTIGVQGGCVSVSKEENEDDLICKEVYLLNSYKRLDAFQRVYFQHYDFYCALDLYICTVSLGKVYRNYKFQLVEYTMNQKLQKSTKSFSNKMTPSLSESVYSANQQVVQYSQLKRICQKYQNLSKVKKSFLYQSIDSVVSQQIFEDLSHLTYSYKDYEKLNLYEAIMELQHDKQMINDNIRYLFSKLPKFIKQISLSTFKILTGDSIKKKFDLKKKYLLKKVPHSSMCEKSIDSIDKFLNPRKSFDNASEMTNVDMIKSSYTFKQNRKLQKQEFIHIRREQFIKSFQIINIKDLVFPMILIEKSSSAFQTQKKLETAVKIPAHKIVVEESKYDEVSLIVLIHGYQGSHHDLKKIKNYLEYLSPNLKILPITSIEKNINENLKFLGEKVASEIEFFILNSYENIKKINFIGFSLGGVIARACLKHLTKYKSMMNTLITLASPHLGVSESQNTFVNFGVWYLSKIDKVKNIKELNFQSITQKDSFMMQLSNSEEISWFRKVVLVSSSEDEFVPHYSARIMAQTKNPEINRMALNLISKIQNYERIEVWFDVDKKTSLDKVIGRKSHIEFIENYSFVQMLCKIYEKDF